VDPAFRPQRGGFRLDAGPASFSLNAVKKSSAISSRPVDQRERPGRVAPDAGLGGVSQARACAFGLSETCAPPLPNPAAPPNPRRRRIRIRRVRSEGRVSVELGFHRAHRATMTTGTRCPRLSRSLHPAMNAFRTSGSFKGRARLRLRYGDQLFRRSFPWDFRSYMRHSEPPGGRTAILARCSVK